MFILLYKAIHFLNIIFGSKNWLTVMRKQILTTLKQAVSATVVPTYILQKVTGLTLINAQ